MATAAAAAAAATIRKISWAGSCRGRQTPSLRRCLSGARAVDDLLVTVSFDQNKIAVVTLNTPKNLNALTVDMGQAFEKKIKELKDMGTDKLRCVILTGAGALLFRARTALFVSL
jgi:hypothetical protein